MKKIILFSLFACLFLGAGQLKAQPVNDDCINAITLTPDSTVNFQSFSFDNATRETINASGSCGLGGAPTYEDVFFKFTATDYGHNIIVKNDYDFPANYMEPGIMLMEGDCSSGFTVIDCAVGVAAFGSESAAIRADYLAPGTEYYVYVSNMSTSHMGNYLIQVTRPTVNGEICETSKEVFVNESYEESNFFCTNYGEDMVITPDDICAITLENGLWYEFTPTVTGSYDFTFNNILYSTSNTIGLGYQIGFYASTSDCVLDYSMGCDSSDYNSSMFTFNMDAGTKYYFVYDGDAGSLATFDLIIEGPPAAPDPSSISENGILNVKTYPSPAADWLNIELEYTTGLTIEVYSIVGELEKIVNPQQGKIQLDISDLSSGMHLLKVNSKVGRNTTTFMKE